MAETHSFVRPLPSALNSLNPVRWLTVFGPGAIMASLTIGTGELIFSTRGGALFGYRILFLFAAISLCKWVLVFSTARHMVLTGVHPLERWMALPFGPRGWLPSVMFVFAILCVPVWLSFHASVIGDLVAGWTRTKGFLNGATVHLWGAVALVAMVCFALQGGYKVLERIQLVMVVTMLFVVTVALFLLKPDWLEMLWSTVVPQRLEFPQWLLDDTRPAMKKIADKPLFIELSLYVGVVGGASYDYLAYTSFLRDKRWGLAGADLPADFKADAAITRQAKKWVRAPLIDCTVSFAVVMVFSAVFVASGWLVLAPLNEIPSDANFLSHQSRFVTQLNPWLNPLYQLGAFLTMLGTLYGTLEIGPAITRESYRLLGDEGAVRDKLRRYSLLWCGIGAGLVLVLCFVNQIYSGDMKPAGLTRLLIPASLFTGVLSCGIICLLNPWMDHRALTPELRSNLVLQALNILAGIVLLIVGLIGYWENGGWKSLGMLAATCAVGFAVAPVLLRKRVERP